MKTPMSSDTKLMKDEECELVDSTKYRGIIGCCLTSWFSKKQTALAIFTTKAKYVSAGKACQQAPWMKQALIDYDIRLDDVPIISGTHLCFKDVDHTIFPMVNTIKGFKDVTMSLFAPSIRDHIFYTLFVVSGSIVLGNKSSVLLFHAQAHKDDSEHFHLLSPGVGWQECQLVHEPRDIFFALRIEKKDHQYAFFFSSCSLPYDYLENLDYHETSCERMVMHLEH
ncbi:hypothetical protein Tco_1492596 [Tanacetum coccineum]|uniref:Uncharacterized protein n=1 Tax=Tanacetum coccineum TaxID=301880 RepID=A0ABQ4WXK4_9ASTR